MLWKNSKKKFGDDSHMSEWWREASQLQSSVSESEKTDDTEFSEQRALNSTVYARLDIVLMVSLLNSLNKQIYWIKVCLFVIAGLLFWRMK
jgi:hypothetical protein